MMTSCWSAVVAPTISNRPDIKDSLGSATEAEPIVTSVSLVEVDPSSDPRFTSSTFNAQANLAFDGISVSTKTIDAYVEGAIRETGNFDEPLASSETAVPAAVWSSSISGWSNAARAYDGDEALTQLACTPLRVMAACLILRVQRLLKHLLIAQQLS